MDEQFELHTIITDEFPDPATTIEGISTLVVDEVSDERQMFFTETFVYNLFIMIINISTIFFNGVVIFIVARYREMRNTVTLCFMNLAITDIVYVLAQSSYPLKITTGFDVKAFIPCNLSTYLHFATITATGLTMTFLAFDRYMVISRPLVNLKNRSYTKVMLSFVAVWILSFAIHACIPFIHVDVGHYCKNVYPNVGDQTGERIYQTFKAFINYVFPLTVSSFFYLRIYVILRYSSPCHGNSAVATVGNGQHSLRSRRLRGIRVAAMVLILYAVCYLPTVTLTLWRAWDPNFPDQRFFVYHLATALFAKICIFFNPFLYTLSAPSFQAKLRKAICCCREDTVGTNIESSITDSSKPALRPSTFTDIFPTN